MVPWKRLVLEKSTFVAFIKNFATFYLNSAVHYSLINSPLKALNMKLNPAHSLLPSILTSTLIQSSSLRQNTSRGFFSADFYKKCWGVFFTFLLLYYMSPSFSLFVYTRPVTQTDAKQSNDLLSSTLNIQIKLLRNRTHSTSLSGTSWLMTWVEIHVTCPETHIENHVSIRCGQNAASNGYNYH